MLNIQEYYMARNLQKSSIAPRAAREHLVQHVVAMEELQFQQAGRPLTITPEFKDHIDKYWQSFMEDVVRHTVVCTYNNMCNRWTRS